MGTMTEPPLQQSTFGLQARHPPRASWGGKFLAVLAVIGFLLAAAAGYAVYHRFAALERKIEAFERTSKAGLDDVAALTARLNDILESQRRIEAAIARPETTSTPLEPRPNLSESDLELLRSFFRLTKRAGARPQFNLGDRVASDELKAMPEFVAANISAALRGTRFLFDVNGALVITAGPNNEVVAIVSG
jgi:hypothetical protein